MPVRICTWKQDKRWVYSVTYDEALADLARFVIPLHEEFRIRGHVEVVAGQIGQVRAVEGSSFNGMRHMNAQELRNLIALGWGVGNHSWSHGRVEDDVDRELGRAKEQIEAAIGQPVVLYCSPGNNRNMTPDILEACRRHGYLAAMSITDAVNRSMDELFWLNRCPLHHELPPPFCSAFDPWHRIRQAQESHGWIIDYLHCPLEEPVHPAKDASWRELRQRFEAVRQDGGNDVWLATPEEALDYHLARRHARLTTLREGAHEMTVRVTCDGLPAAVRRRVLTFELETPASWRPAQVLVNGVLTPCESRGDTHTRLDVDMSVPAEIRVQPGKGA